MQYPLSEVFDRLTIETRKRHYGARNERLLIQYLNAIEKIEGTHISAVAMALTELAVANADIANLEWAIRTNQELSAEEVGRRALAIRDINDRRIAAKTHLARLLGEHVDPSRYDQKQKFTSVLQLPEKSKRK